MTSAHSSHKNNRRNRLIEEGRGDELLYSPPKPVPNEPNGPSNSGDKDPYHTVKCPFCHETTGIDLNGSGLRHPPLCVPCPAFLEREPSNKRDVETKRKLLKKLRT